MQSVLQYRRFKGQVAVQYERSRRNASADDPHENPVQSRTSSSSFGSIAFLSASLPNMTEILKKPSRSVTKISEKPSLSTAVDRMSRDIFLMSWHRKARKTYRARVVARTC